MLPAFPGRGIGSRRIAIYNRAYGKTHRLRLHVQPLTCADGHHEPYPLPRYLAIIDQTTTFDHIRP
jgi:hypothetical protein